MNSNNQARYTTTAILLHWVIALLVFALFAVGWNMVDLPRGPDRSYNFALHKSLGLTVFGLAVVRLVWRYFHRPPPYPESMARWRITLARSAHLLFYVLLILQPVSGYISSSFSGYSTKYFGLPLPGWGWRDPPLNEFFTEIHVMNSVLFLVLIGVHVAGALTHLFDQDRGILRRILPW
jgi:cytochrome b561